MKKYFPAYIRIPVFFFGSALLLEYFIDSGDLPAFMKYPEVLGLLTLILLVIITFEACNAAINTIAWRLLTNEEQKEKLKAAAKKPSWISKFYKEATNAIPIDQEDEIILNHNYDGIKELDNALPPWWVWGFYATIVFAVVYMAKYHVFGGETQSQEFETEMEQARIDIEEYKKTAKDLVDYTTVVALTEVADITAGKEIFIQNCAVCHKPDGAGGIGPNLTDEYWVLGGGIKNVFKTISQGGRPSKGMEAWSKKGLKPSKIQQVASYILTLEGTNPAGAKKPEGELWVNTAIKTSETKEVKGIIKVDTLQVR
ncbi:MAG: c-type cytochrome [Flavobacteriaceae bacterium]|nr:c-type cytochrome [Flavobacteriaceae bacterium]